jgi:rubrerythrin
MTSANTGYPASANEAIAMLASRDRLSIDDLKVMAMIEQSGEAFYMSMARVAGNSEARALLERNAHEELGHAHRLQTAVRLLGGTFSLPKVDENPYALPSFFDDLDLNFLAELIKGEEDGDMNYQRWADNEPNADVAHLLRLNGKEETMHGQRVAKVISLLQ